jgi:hypothetical protein
VFNRKVIKGNPKGFIEGKKLKLSRQITEVTPKNFHATNFLIPTKPPWLPVDILQITNFIKWAKPQRLERADRIASTPLNNLLESELNS